MQQKQEEKSCGITVDDAIKNKQLLATAVRHHNIIQSYLLTPDGQLKETISCLTILLIEAMDRAEETDRISMAEIREVLRLYHVLNEIA